MFSKSRTFGVVAVLCLASVLAFSPAPASTAYEMGGGGTLTKTTASPGMPACAPVVNQPAASCGTNTVTTWTFGGIPIFSAGVLFDRQQAGDYNCAASIVTTRGGTDNFRLDWDFDCTRANDGSVGWPRITGQFNNNSSPGVPIFAGCFKVNSTDPYTCSSSGGGQWIAATCAGMFEPTAFDGAPPKITQVLFEGECTSAAA